jgi:hypothetical protein
VLERRAVDQRILPGVRHASKPIVAEAPYDFQEPGVLAAVPEVRVGVCRPHVVGQGRAHGDLDALQRVHDQQPQGSVEDIEVELVVEGAPPAAQRG